MGDTENLLPEGHQCCNKWNSFQGVEIWSLWEDQLHRCKDNNEICLSNRSECRSCYIKKLLQWFSSSDHIHNICSHLNNKLLWSHNPEPELRAERILPQFMIAIEPLTGQCLMHLNHLPQWVQCDQPWDRQCKDSRNPEPLEMEEHITFKLTCKTHNGCVRFSLRAFLFVWNGTSRNYFHKCISIKVAKIEATKVKVHKWPSNNLIFYREKILTRGPSKWNPTKVIVSSKSSPSIIHPLPL